jgi:hypothetical protein
VQEGLDSLCSTICYSPLFKRRRTCMRVTSSSFVGLIIQICFTPYLDRRMRVWAGSMRPTHKSNALAGILQRTKYEEVILCFWAGSYIFGRAWCFSLCVRNAAEQSLHTVCPSDGHITRIWCWAWAASSGEPYILVMLLLSMGLSYHE